MSFAIGLSLITVAPKSNVALPSWGNGSWAITVGFKVRLRVLGFPKDFSP
jgi:hypothetical protein